MNTQHVRKAKQLAPKLSKISVMTAAALGVAAPASVAAGDGKEFIMRVPIEAKLTIPQWIIINYINGAWANAGAPLNCLPWTPDVSAVDWDKSFQQVRQCDQLQVRNVTPILYNPVLRTSKNGEQYEEENTVKVTQYQAAIGRRDFIAGERPDAWAQWRDTGDHYGCDVWAPATDTVNLFDAFEQTRDCDQDQQRDRQVYHVWASGKETPKRVDVQKQTIIEMERRAAQGTKDYIDGERIGVWSSWMPSGARYSCDPWSPSPDTVNLHVDFEQTRNCSQNYSRERGIYDVWRSGKETLNQTEPGAKTEIVAETQTAEGTKDFIASVSYDPWTEWTQVTNHSHTAWSPLPTTVNLGEAFVQSRNYQEDQTRTRKVYDVWASGKKTFLRDDDEARTLARTESRPSTGEKDYIASSSADSWSAWAPVKDHSHTAWSPLPTTVNLNEDFVQSRDYKQDQSRTRNVYDVWASGKKTVNRKETDTQTVSLNENRGATGSKDYIASTRAGAWSAWGSNNDHSYTAWSPTPDTVNLGEQFTQTRAYKTDQSRTRTIYNVWASGKETVLRNESGAQTIDQSESRVLGGTKDYIAQTRTTSWTAWTGVKNHSHTAWSPVETTVNLGQQFTQSRDYKQDQTRTRKVYNVWASGEETLLRNESDAQTVSLSQSRSATGSKNYIASTSNGAWTAWADTSRHSYGAWSPSVDTVLFGQAVTQSRSYMQDQSRSRVIYHVWADGSKTQKSTETDTQSVSKVESKVATGTKDFIADTRYGAWSAWSNSGSAHSYTGYLPSASTVNWGVEFTQSRTYIQPLKRTRTVYDVWAGGEESVKRTDTETKDDARTQTRLATGSKDYVSGTTYSSWSAWSNDGGAFGHSAWDKSCESVNLGTTFTRTRTYQQAQTRARTKYQTWASGKAPTAIGTETGTQTITKTQTDSEAGCKDFISSSSTGSWSAWANSGTAHSYTAYSPSPSTVNLGQSFTQSRAYKQPQTRTRTVYNVWKSGKQTVKDTNTETRDLASTQSRPATGTKDYITSTSAGSWSAWSNNGSAHSYSSYSPSTSTVNWGVNFTQSRTYVQPLKRTRTIYNVWKSGQKTAKTTETDTTNDTRTQTIQATGTKDIVTGTSYGGWSAWSNDGSAHSYSSYSPSPSTVNWGVNFTQSRTYVQPLKRTRTVYNVWASGAKTPKSTDTETTNSTRTQTRAATGTKDYTTGTTYSSWSGWSNTSGGYGHSGWDKSCGSYNLGTTFTRSRTYKVDQVRTRTKSYTWASGKAPTAYGTETDTRVDTRTQYDSEAGCRDYVTGTTYGAWSGWSNNGSAHSYSSYSPSTSTVNWGQSFTQSRTYVQPLKRTRTVYNVWKSGKQTVKSTDTATTDASRTQTRSATGTKDYTTGTTYGSWSSWSNTSGAYGHSSWDKSCESYNIGTTFTRSRTYKVNQSSTRTKYYTWASGKQPTAYGTDTQTRVDTRTQTDSEAGCRDFDTGSSSTGSWSSWDFVKNHTYSAWSPATSTVNWGQSYTASRSYSEQQKRTRSVYDVYASGKTTYSHTQTEYRNLARSQSTTLTGTKDYIKSTRTAYGSWSSWSNTSCSSWSPSVFDMPDGTSFTQSRTCQQQRTQGYTTYNVYASGKETQKSTGTNSQTRSNTESRTAYGAGQEPCPYQKPWEPPSFCQIK
jgi:hypothetical protein